MQWIAAISELIAKWAVGNHSKWGHLMHLVAGILWTIVALDKGIYAMLIITVPSFVLNIRNFRKWHRECKNSQL